MKAFVTLALSLALATALSAQSLNHNWKKDLAASLEVFKGCAPNNTGTPTNCNKLQGETLNTVYKVNDFFSQKAGRYMTVSEVAGFLKQSGSWTALGPAYLQETLSQAQQAANENKAVVAVYQNASAVGHVALILPGELEASGSWGLNVPNTASFFLPDPGRSFVAKGLSFAFTKIMLKDIAVYVRKY
ncbi:hypothetical protein [Dawidia soli]|uniref:Uncharacterized protein n=1 Tax=Dawidia soli TaxID=2782352 RepID=A0AAP2DDC3_9BACT|nr:hypothetical protein [Dawidia soli]MBT1689939.1 hypothetical protein [Dawidia soli]